MTRLLPLVLVLLVAGAAAAQTRSTPTADAEWPLGTWAGAHRELAFDSDVTRCEFFWEYGRMRWRMTRRATMSRDATMTLTAAGFVSQLSASSIELDGRYSVESGRELGGLSVRYVLTRTDDTLAGTVATSRGQGTVTLTKR